MITATEDKPASQIQLNKEIVGIQSRWQRRCSELEYKVGSKTYQKALIEFLCGVIACADACNNADLAQWATFHCQLGCVRPNWTIWKEEKKS